MINTFVKKKVALTEEKIKDLLQEKFSQIFVKKKYINKQAILIRLAIVFKRHFVRSKPKPTDQ